MHWSGPGLVLPVVKLSGAFIQPTVTWQDVLSEEYGRGKLRCIEIVAKAKQLNWRVKWCHVEVQCHQLVATFTPSLLPEL